MKNIRLFETEDDFMDAYDGSEYIEPWMSYTRETEHVDYNKPKTVWFRLPKYDSPDGQISVGAWTQDEVDVLNSIFEYIIPDGYGEGWHDAMINENFNVEVYTVTGVVSGFDKNDHETYQNKYILDKDSSIEIYFSGGTGNAVRMAISTYGVYDEEYGSLELGAIDCTYDFTNNTMVSTTSWYGDLPV